MNPTDPTPTPAAPDWRELCCDLLEAIDDDVIDCNDGPRFQSVVDRVRAALATDCARAALATTREAIDPDADDVQVLAAIVREVDGSNRLGAAALAEAILSHPLWPELLPPAAPTREAAPVEQQGAEISDEELDDLCSKFSFFTDDDESKDLLFEMLRTVWARAQAARPAIQPVEWDDKRLPTDSDCYFNPGATDGFLWVFYPEGGYDGQGWWGYEQWDGEYFNEESTHWLPHWALPLPAADQQEGRDAAAGEVQP